MTTETARFTKDDIGCYFDCARGWADIGDAIRDMAATYGHPFVGPITGIHAISDGNTTWDDWYDLTIREAHRLQCTISEAEDYLNTLTDNDVFFGSNESGDWGLWHICPDDSNDGLDCNFCESQ